MNSEQIKEYLGIVVDMEKNVYLQNQAVMRLKGEINSLGIPRHFEEPQKPAEYKSDAPATIIFCLIFGIIGFLIFRWGFRLFTGTTLIGFIIGLFAAMFGGSCIIGMIILAVTDLAKDSRSVKDSQIRQRQYAVNMRNYEDNQREDNERVKNELIRKSALNAELGVLESHLNKSLKNLFTIYDKNIIFPKYRRLPLVCSLYESFCSGRCSTLEGHEGLEMEIRLDRIITQMDMVITRLESIRDGQYVLYSAIQDSNRKYGEIASAANGIAYRIDDMVSRQKLSGESLQRELRRLHETSAINAYHTERMHKELEYMNRMNYLSGRYDGTFFNQPPH